MSIQQSQETMKVSGIGKFTHISASETELNFGDALVGSPTSAKASPGLVATEKELVLRNRSLVRASFRIQNVENDHDPVFFFTPTSGVIAPESTATIKVRYTPLSAGTFTCDHFDIVTPGSNVVRITCKGRAIGPTLSVWKKNAESNFVPTRSINFQDVEVGKHPATRVISLRNESPLEILYQFDAQERGVFRFDCVNGRIPPFLDRNVTITFSPTQAGNFYRRYFLLIQNQTTQFVDFLGTGYDDKTRPSPFQQAHVDAYRMRREAGIGLLSPDQLENYQQDHGNNMFLKGSLRRAKESETDQQDGTSWSGSIPSRATLQTRSGEATLAEIEVAHEYFVSVDNKGNPVVVACSQLDFGNCSIVQFPTKKVLHVTNNTHGKVTCSWRVSTGGGQGEVNVNPTTNQQVFQVYPEITDIGAGETAEFRVAFQPTQINTYYFAELEGFVSFKSNRTFRLVNVDTFTPPWCVVTKVCGNTFPSPTEQFLAKIRFCLSKNKAYFPPCHLGDCVFQTFAIENSSDTPALFAFTDDPSEIFQCKPQCGYIPPKSFHLVAIRFAPRQVRSYSYGMQCVVNNAFSKPEVIELTGVCSIPRLALPECVNASEVDARVYIKPTAIGLHSLRRIEIVNKSRVPLVFKWQPPQKHQDIFQVRPKLGRLNGCESVAIEFMFAPNEVREYLSRFALTVKSISLSPQDSVKSHQNVNIPALQEITVRAVTKGTIGAIRFHPQSLVFETILVNTTSQLHFYLENTADCDLIYRLEPELVSTKNPSSEKQAYSSSAPAALTFSESRGCIPAQSKKKIVVTFQPALAGAFTFKVACAIGDETSASTLPRWDFPNFLEASCTVSGDASFPTIEIQDLRVPGTPSTLAWEQFQCNSINHFMAAPLSEVGDEEQPRDRPRSANGAEHPELQSARDNATHHRHFVVPFSPAPLGSPSEQAFFLLRNPGNLIVDFSLRLPKEGNVEIEHWAETGAPSPEEVRTNAIIDTKIFGIYPRRATLLPQQSVLLTLSYSYSSQLYSGSHDLPIRLEVDKGKQITLELHGKTLAPREPKLFVPSHTFYLSPVMIGEYRRCLTVPEHSNMYGKEHDNRNAIHSLTHINNCGQGGPPIQQIQVFNRGDSAFRLDVGSNSFDRVNTDSYGYPVLSCQATSEIVPAKSSIYIDVIFNPIETKTVRTDLILKAHGLMGRAYKEAVMITVVAAAYHPKQWTLQQLRREQLISIPAPRKQILGIPKRAARFAVDSVEFNHVPMNSQIHRLLVLKNDCPRELSSSCLFTYQWDPTHPLVANGTIAFAPAKGELAPGEQVLLRVSLHTTSTAMVVNHSVACLVNYANPVGTSTDGGNQHGSFNGRKVSAPRTSVIHRSTATQEAATLDGTRSPTKANQHINQTQYTTEEYGRKHLSSSKASGKRKPTDKSAKSMVQTEETVVASVPDTSDPIFVQIYAHVLPDEVFEKTYPQEDIERRPLPSSEHSTLVLPPPPSSSQGQGSTRTPLSISTRFAKTPVMSAPRRKSGTLKSDQDPAKCREVVEDVLEALVVDTLNCSDVQDAMNDQLGPISRAEHAVIHGKAGASSRKPLCFPHARRSDDCQSILSGVLENTVSNVLQELFHGDLESELLCLPRKAVFPGKVKSKRNEGSPRTLDR